MVPSALAGNDEQLVPILNIDMRRSEMRPDPRSAADVGLSDVTDFGWGAIYVAASVSREKVEVLENAFVRLNQNEEYRAAMLDMHTTPVFVPGAEWEERVAAQRARMGEILADLGLKKK
jgi:tripartite-type tricarboxylate transporter receptor subunit TctC